MITETRNIVAIVAYLFGVGEEQWKLNYAEFTEKDLYEKLENNKDAKILRCLCRLRSSLIHNFRKTDQQIAFYIKNLNSLEWFDQNDIKSLKKLGVDVILINKKATDYVTHFHKLISEKIVDCRQLFDGYTWLKWETIKTLFVPPSWGNKDVQIKEHDKFYANYYFYPYQCYFYWQSPCDAGNILHNDLKFLKFAYQQFGLAFNDTQKVTNMSDSEKYDIYEFINSHEKTDIVVDCENGDVYKLVSMLTNLETSELAKINKIILFDDVHTNEGWDILPNFTDISIEHIIVERLLDRKSLVDIRMTAGVCKEFYAENVTSFIFLSSDSDFWGLISSLPQADFLVMLEEEKTSNTVIKTLEQTNIKYCMIDDFCSGNIDGFKTTVLLNELKKELPNIIGKNAMGIAHNLFATARIVADKPEIYNFYNKYIKTLTLTVNEDGFFEVTIKTP